MLWDEIPVFNEGNINIVVNHLLDWRKKGCEEYFGYVCERMNSDFEQWHSLAA